MHGYKWPINSPRTRICTGMIQSLSVVIVIIHVLKRNRCPIHSLRAHESLARVCVYTMQSHMELKVQVLPRASGAVFLTASVDGHTVTQMLRQKPAAAAAADGGGQLPERNTVVLYPVDLSTH